VLSGSTRLRSRWVLIVGLIIPFCFDPGRPDRKGLQPAPPSVGPTLSNQSLVPRCPGREEIVTLAPLSRFCPPAYVEHASPGQRIGKLRHLLTEPYARHVCLSSSLQFLRLISNQIEDFVARHLVCGRKLLDGEPGVHIRWSLTARNLASRSAAGICLVQWRRMRDRDRTK
jgi:hypothetical protein